MTIFQSMAAPIYFLLSNEVGLKAAIKKQISKSLKSLNTQQIEPDPEAKEVPKPLLNFRQPIGASQNQKTEIS